KIPLSRIDPRTHAHPSVLANHEEVHKAGYRFEIIPKEEIAGYISRLRVVSDAWLQQRNDRERQFSIGYFDRGYLQHFPAVVIRYDDEIVAFSNILEGAGLHEFSIDLLRYLPDTHEHVVD